MQPTLLLFILPVVGALRREPSLEYNDVRRASDNLCSHDIVEEARATLGAETKENLMSLLSLEKVELDELLIALELKQISVDALCASAISHIKTILHKDVPLHSDEACLTPDCSTTMVVSDEKLAELDAEVDLDKIVFGHDLQTIIVNETIEEVPYKPSVEQMLRRLLAILFHVHPQIDIVESEENDNESASTSFAESTQNPAFANSVSRRQKKQLQQAYSGASARLSSGLRKINADQTSLVKKYFKASSKFVSVLKKHYSLIFDSLSNAYTTSGGKFCEPFVSAYVQVKIPKDGPAPSVRDFKACGITYRGKHVVNYCKDFFQRPREMANVVLHEHSHHFGTKDHAYGEPRIFRLSARDQQDNADNYAYFLWALSRGSSGGGEGDDEGGRGAGPDQIVSVTNCFPLDARVRVESHQNAEKPIVSLAPGDELFDEVGGKNEYLFDFHEDELGRQGVMVSYLRIEHSLQKEGRPLFITKDHLLFACADESNCEKEVLPAGEVAVGTHFLLVPSSEGSGTRRLVPSKVTSVESVRLRGYAGPMSSSGTLVVEGVLVSSYALLSDRQVSLWKRGPAWLRRNTQNICHLVSLPLRWARLIGGLNAYMTSISGAFDQLSDTVLQFEWSAVSA